MTAPDDASTATPTAPIAPKRPETTVYHGVPVTEGYRWLEDFDDPEVRVWSDAQNRHARAVLDAIPDREAIVARLKELNSEKAIRHFALQSRAGKLFAMKSHPPKQQPFLVVMDSADAPESERVVLDPNTLDPTGATSMDWYVPSLDGKLVAVCMSLHGSEDGSVRVFDVETGAERGDVVPRVNYPTGGGSLAWRPGSAGFYYTRYPQGDERPPEDANFYLQVYLHTLGQPASEDTYVLGEGFPRIAEIFLSTTEDGRYTLATVANGDGGEFAHYVQGDDGAWAQVADFADGVKRAVLGPDAALYVVAFQDAPRGRVLRLPLGDPRLAAAEAIIPEGENAIVEVVPTESRLYTVEVAGGPFAIRSFDHRGGDGREVPVKPISSVGRAIRDGADGLLFYNETFTEPGAWYRYNPATGEVARTALFRTAPVDFSDLEVIRDFATSQDGTRVPFTVLMRKGTERTGDIPTLLYGYGGYGAIESPRLMPNLRLWLDAGGIWVSANIRGGGEYGEAWHLDGNLTKKQNVFDDFIAVAEHLIAEQYTRPEKLAIQGGSNGGLLMGAVMTQRPDLFRAVVAHVGIFDSLRVELTPNGAFNITEFGTVEDPDHFPALLAYSPYHNVKDGEQYPATLFLTGDYDGRVDPANSRKMTARLQASGTHQPVLLRTSSISGHGIGTSLDEGIAQSADVYAFLFRELGMESGPAD